MKNFSLKILLIIAIALSVTDLSAQFNLASPSNWLYPNGNSEATKQQIEKSGAQEIDSLRIKWSTSSISGDVQPLIGNIINNSKLFPDFKYAPNEIVAVMAGRIIVVDAKGNTHRVTNHYNPFFKNVSCLFDTNSTGLNYSTTSPQILGIEMIEFENKFDSLAYTFIAGFDNKADTIRMLKRLAIDLRPYKPNTFASIKPVYGKRIGQDIFIYATVNMSKPAIQDTFAVNPPFLRGFTQFKLEKFVGSYPMPDAGDEIDFRMTLGPEVGFAQPSLTMKYGQKESILLPTYPQPDLNMMISNQVNTVQTFTNRPYLLGYDITIKKPQEDVGPLNLNIIPEANLRPQIRPYYIKLSGTNTNDSNFILLTEEYKGVGLSIGKPKLHLYNSIGDPITLPDDPSIPSYSGDMNHEWSVAVGDLDGVNSNEWLPYYPNIKGNEIIVTQSSRNFAYPGSRIMVLRYREGINIEKPSPPGTVLFPFDTICTQRINGWVAAVNDIDGANDEKSEIFVVDGSVLRVLKLRDYQTDEFRNGTPFDTVYSVRFPQTISNVAISDLEGDGLNDMIVTTFDSTYVIGKQFMNSLKALMPKFSDTVDVCIGDTLKIQWMNYMKSSGGIDIGFQEYLNNSPKDSLIKISSNLKNQLDTNTYIYKIESKLIGKTGKFIISNSDNPKQNNDTTSFITVNKPQFLITSASTSPLFVGEEIFLKGTASCFDSITIEVSLDNTKWTKISASDNKKGNDFDLKAIVPCPSFFRCDSLESDSLVYARLITSKSSYNDTSSSLSFRIFPKKLNYTLDTNTTADPSKTFRWKSKDLLTDCDTLDILFSLNNGSSYSLLESVAVDQEKFTWQVPLNLPDSVMFRLCCNTCMRSDTTLKNYKPTYIQIVAPNPFRPLVENAEIIYKVDAETSVTIRIIDQADRLVAEPVKDQTRYPDIAYADKWDGLRWDGSPCDSGMYYIILQFSNGKREVYPIFVRK
jgi:hypothetical protein